MRFGGVDGRGREAAGITRVPAQERGNTLAQMQQQQRGKAPCLAMQLTTLTDASDMRVIVPVEPL